MQGMGLLPEDGEKMNTRKYQTIAWQELQDAIGEGLTLRQIAERHSLSLQGLQQAASVIDELSPESRITTPPRVARVKWVSDPFNRREYGRNA